MIRNNSYIKDMRSKALKGIEKKHLFLGEKEKIELQVKEQKITRLVANQKLEELDIDYGIKSMINETIKDITKINNIYIEKIKDWDKPSGENIHSDVKLLEEHYPMTKQELQELGLKHKNNMTMQRIINKYSLDHNMGYIGSITSDEKIKALNEITATLTGVLNNSDGYIGNMVVDIEYWNDYIDNFNVTLGDGSEISNEI